MVIHSTKLEEASVSNSIRRTERRCTHSCLQNIWPHPESCVTPSRFIFSCSLSPRKSSVPETKSPPYACLLPGDCTGDRSRSFPFPSTSKISTNGTRQIGHASSSPTSPLHNLGSSATKRAICASWSAFDRERRGRGNPKECMLRNWLKSTCAAPRGSGGERGASCDGEAGSDGDRARDPEGDEGIVESMERASESAKMRTLLVMVG